MPKLSSLQRMVNETKDRHKVAMRRYYKFKYGVSKFGLFGISSIDLYRLDAVHVTERSLAIFNREFMIDVMFVHIELSKETDVSFIVGGGGGFVLGPDRTTEKTVRSLRHYKTMSSVEQELSCMKEQYGRMDWEVRVQSSLLEE